MTMTQVAQTILTKQGVADLHLLTEMIKSSRNEQLRGEMFSWKHAIADGDAPELTVSFRKALLKLQAGKKKDKEFAKDAAPGVVNCGPLPLLPPGCVGNAPRFGRVR